MKKAIFFDLDGTLWDALDSLTKSWNETCKNNNLPYFFSQKIQNLSFWLVYFFDLVGYDREIVVFGNRL